MATNLVSQIVETLSPTIVARIASALGLNQTGTQKAVVAAVPAMLAALIAYVSKPQGAAKLNDVVAKQEPGVLSSLASVIGGSGQKALIDQGGSLLTSLLGGKDASALTSAVGQYAGIGEGSKGLMGLLGPVVLGVLGQQQRSSGLDASGLANLLNSQKANVAAALPSGFSKYLDQTNILDGLEGVTRSVAKPAQEASSGSSAWRWLLAALALLALGVLVWRLSSGTPQPTAEAPTPQLEAPYAGVLAKLKGVKAGDVDLGDLATTAVNGLHASLSGIKDEASAQAALPGLTTASSQFDQLTALLGQLSPDTRKTLAEAIAGIRPNLDQLIDKVLAIPGVGAVVQPAADAIRSKLDALATI